MLLILLLPVAGIGFALLLNKVFPHAKFRSTDVLPFFFLLGCHFISRWENKPGFLPYGFFFFFLLVIILAVTEAVEDKNINLSKIGRELWDFLTVNSIFWYLGLLFLMI